MVTGVAEERDVPPGKSRVLRVSAHGAATTKIGACTGGNGVVLMNGRHISGAGKLAGLAGGIFVGVTTGNPFPAIAAAVDFVAWVNGVWQESNAEAALDALKESLSETATVLRDGQLVCQSRCSY